MRPVQSLEKSVCMSKCDQKHNHGFAKREMLKPKVNVFCTKIVEFKSRAEQTVATQVCHKGAEPPAAE